MKKRKKHPALKIYLISRWLYLHNLEIIAKVFYYLNIIIFQASIAYEADIHESVIFPHPRGVMIHPHTTIGENTIIYQRVTLGDRSLDGEVQIHIGKNCFIGANSFVLGVINIGDNVKIGCNTVVLENVKPNCTVVGVPGKVVKKSNKKASRKK